MKEKFLLALVLFVFLPVFIMADNLRIVDNAGVLSPQERTLLGEIADSMASAYDFDLVIVIESSIGNVSPARYADDFFDDRGYGLGQNRDGALFLHVTGSRDYFFSTSGRGIRLFNNTALDKLESDVLVQLRAGNNFQAYQAFLRNSEEFLNLEARGRNYNVIHRWNAVLVSIAWFLALVIGFLTVSIWKKQMNTALLQSQADTYVVPGSFNLKVQKDKFLYSTVTKTRRQNQSGSSGSLRTSSSGRQKGGRGGKY